MSLAMMLRRLEIDATTRTACAPASACGARTSAHVEFELAEACLSHRVGQRTVSRPTPGRACWSVDGPIMPAWANHVTGKEASN